MNPRQLQLGGYLYPLDEELLNAHNNAKRLTRLLNATLETERAKRSEIAKELFDIRDGMWPDLYSVDEILEICRTADILVVAIGKADFVSADMVKPGAVVIDVGMNRNQEGKLVGDVDFESAEAVAGYLTPVPGGVGTVTTAVLCKHVIEAAEKI